MMLFVLKKPLVFGQTMHRYLLAQVSMAREDAIRINLSEEDIQAYNGMIEGEI